MLFRCCKLRKWVWTKTGKGDRLGGGGDSRVGPSPFLERPAPPHSFRNLTGPYQRLASFICRPVVLHLLVRVCFALPHLPALSLTPCLLPFFHCPCVHHPTMCARTIHLQCFARTALQAATPPGLQCAAHTLLCFCIHPFPVPETSFKPQTVDFCCAFLHR